MSEHQSDKVQAAIDRELGLAEEVEASAHVAVGGVELADARAALHKWVDSVQGVVINAAFGRVTLIHENGRRSTIASSELPYTLSTPVKPKSDA